MRAISAREAEDGRQTLSADAATIIRTAGIVLHGEHVQPPLLTVALTERPAGQRRGPRETGLKRRCEEVISYIAK